jgi:geranylgeranylglycerol-phosphate geranylgeranyltransferase
MAGLASRWRDFFELMVPEYIPMAITGALAGATAATRAWPDERFLLVCVVLALIVGAFNAYNAVVDRKIDSINKPWRPVPRGAIKPREAFTFSVILYAAALILSAGVSAEFFVLSVVSTLVTAAYSLPGLHLKRRFIVGNLSGSFFHFVLVPLLGWALTPTAAIPWIIILFLFALSIGLSNMKDFEDYPGDQKYGAQTLPVRLGLRGALSAVIVTVSAAFFILVYSVLQGALAEKYLYLAGFFPLLFLTIVFLYGQYNQAKSHRAFIRTVILIMLAELAIAYLATSPG